MHRHLSHHLLLLAALLCIFPATYGFWWNTDEIPHAVVKRDITPRSYHSLLPRTNEPESDSDEDLPMDLGLCVPRCILTGEGKNTGGSKVKRTDVLSESSSCSRGPSACSQIHDTSGNATHRFEKRTGRALPGYGSVDDLRTKNQAQLNTWIMQRLPDPRGAAGYPTDVTMLWTDRPEESIDLKTHQRTGYQRAYGIPTSFFETPGNNAFAYGTIGLVGCSAFTVVKTPTPASPNLGFYMAHIWETPGFSNHETPFIPGTPAAPGRPATEDEQPRTWMMAQEKPYITDFIKLGFPQQNYDRWVLPQHRDHPTAFQEGLARYVNNLRDGQVIIMHPRKYDPETVNGVETYVQGNGPQHPTGLTKMHTAINAAMGGRRNVNWRHDYLYLPAREDDHNTRAMNSPSGRSLFEYDPNFDIGGGNTRKMGMLLYEDGGPSGQPDANGIYPPGPGGPFFFDFGP